MTDSQKFFLGRQPILNRDQEIVGYELLFRTAGKNYAEFESYSHASASVIASALTTFGIHEVLGGKLGFLNVHLSLLLSEMLELLPIEQSVLELLEIIEIDDMVVERCKELKALGFRLALDDHEFSPENCEIYNHVDIVKIDLVASNMDELPDIVRQLRQWPIQILAEKVETREEFEICKRMGFDLFQGYFFERPVVLNRKRVDVSNFAMLKLLQRLTVDTSIPEIEQIFRESPSLSYNLLKLVNSVMIGLREKIKNLKHAIVLLGIDNIRRWIQLTLFAGNDDRGVNNPLLEMAAVRGRMMEILVQMIYGKSRDSDLVDAAFMTGILSLLDVLFEAPMDEIVGGLNLDEQVSLALLSREGKLGPLLVLTEKVEVTDFDAVTPLLEQFGITYDDMLDAQLDAFNWRSTILVN